MSRLRTFYDRDIGWFNSRKPDLSDLGGVYLKAALRILAAREIRRSSAKGAVDAIAESGT